HSLLPILGSSPWRCTKHAHLDPCSWHFLYTITVLKRAILRGVCRHTPLIPALGRW
ncbi:hypothetical protein STEG23_002676, partial [Scotinomys teguina]